MIDNITDNKLKLPLGNTEFGTISDNQNIKLFKTPAIDDDQNLTSIEIPSGDSDHQSITDLKKALSVVNQLSHDQKEPLQVLNEIARVYVEILRAETVCIYESHVNGNVIPLVYYPHQLSSQCSNQALLDIISSSILTSLPLMTSALEKDQSAKLWQIPMEGGNRVYATSLALNYAPSTICAITILSKDLQIFSSDSIDIFQLIANMTASHLDKIRRTKALDQKQTEKIALQDEVRKLQNQIESQKRITDSDPQEIYNELEALSFSISHDLRSPLRAILSNCEWLNTHLLDLNPDCRRIILQIAESSENMEKLLDGLLEFSKVIRSESKYSLIDMSVLVQKVSDEILKTETNPSSLSIRIQPLINAYGDETLMRQVWYNLISNAFKFSSHKPERKVGIASYQQNGDITYCVSDNGAGFDMQYVDRLFSAFHRLHGIEEFEGTGIGLAIVNRIIKRHGGRVWAEGKIDEGARFYFTLPERQTKDKT